MNKAKHRSLLAILACLMALLFSVSVLGACGSNETADVGENANGNWYYGVTAPAAELGENGDHYLNTETLTAYAKTADGTWQPTTLYSGAEAPDASAGETGDFYLDTKNGVLYQKGDTLWSIVLTLKGTPGRDGVVWFSGKIDPDTYPEGDTTLKDARNGDFYLNTADFTVWQLQEGVWTNLGGLMGAQGAIGQTGPAGPAGPTGSQGNPGEDGEDGTKWFYGMSAPEDAGISAKAGDLYMRTLPSYKKTDGGTYNGYKIYAYQADVDGGWWKQVIDQSPCTFLGVGHAFGEDNLCKYCGLENVFSASEFHEDTDGNYTIKGAPAGVKEVVVPHEIGGKEVKLDHGAFEKNTDIVSVVIEEGFTELSDPGGSPTRWGTFEGCSNLVSVTLPSTLTKINRRAFYKCTSLKELTVPASVTSIGSEAFYYSGLESISLPEGLSQIDQSAFRNTPLKSVVIPDSVTTIDYFVFAGCTKLESVKIGNGLTEIKGAGGGGTNSGVFSGCENLLSIEIGSSVTTIGKDAFEKCYRLVEVINHSSSLNVQTKAEGAEAGTVGYYAAEIRTEEDATASRITTDGDYKFYTTKKGKKYLVNFVGEGERVTLTLPDDGEEYEIYNYAFYQNKNIADVKFGTKATAIGEYAFAETKLGTNYYYDFTIAGGIKTIGAHAFEKAFAHQEYFVTVYIGDDVTTIGDEAFSGCRWLYEVCIGTPHSRYDSTKNNSNLAEIGQGAFKGCTVNSTGGFRFRNTAEKWKELTADKNVFENVKSITVKCSDGNLKYSNGTLTE